MTKKFKAVDVFNALLGTELAGKKYKGDKVFPEEYMPLVKDFFEGMAENIADTSILDPKALYESLQNKTTIDIVDTVVGLTVKAITTNYKTILKLDDLVEGNPNEVVIKSMFESELEDLAKEMIVNGRLNEEAGRDIDKEQFTKLMNIIDEDKEFYGFEPVELFLGRLPEGDPGANTIKDFDAEELLRYMETNMYITY